MAFALGPYFVRLAYQSEFGPHTMTIPTRNWGAGGGSFGQFTTWEDMFVDADLMLDNLVDVLVPFFPTTASFSNWVIFKKLLEADPAEPVMAGSFTDKDGTSATPGWTQAVQHSFHWNTTLFNPFKIVLLDAVSNNDFSKGFVPGAGDGAALHEQITSVENGWSGRDGARPNTFISETRTLNEKLRRAYRMA